MKAYRKHPFKTFGIRGVVLTTLYILLDVFFMMILIHQQEYVALFMIAPVTVVILGSFYIFFREYQNYLKEIPGVMIENDILVYSKTNGKTVRIPMFQIKEVKLVEHVQTKPVYQIIEFNQKTKSKVLGEMITIKYYTGIVPLFIHINDIYKTPIRDIHEQFLQEMDLDVKE